MKNLFILLLISTSTLCYGQEVEEPIQDFPDIEAEYPGGSKALKKFIINEVTYPAKALENNQSGKVYLSFIVERDGSVSNIKVVKGVCQSLDTESTRVVQKMPNWIPGEHEGKTVRTLCRMPITFTIDTSDDDKKKKKSKRK
jgi:protein TonB